MKKTYSLLLLLLNFLLLAQQNYTAENSYHFYENKGQIIDQKGNSNPSVQYLFNSPGLNVQIKKSGFSYDVFETERKELKNNSKQPESSPAKPSEKKKYSYSSKNHRIDVDFVGGNKNPQIVAEGKSQDYENFYNIPYQPNGVTRVHRYQKITYRNIYPNVDLVFFKPEDSTKTVEYNFIVNPGGKVSDIKLKFNGSKTKLKDGRLSMKLRFGEMQENIPSSWEETGNSKNFVDVEFRDLGNQVFGFAAEKDVSDKTLVIDPVPNRMWSSYYGGDLTDYLREMATDNLGNVLFTGNTFSNINIATSGAFITSIYRPYNLDSYVMKLDSNGNKLWGTYTNGAVADIHADSNNNVIATGNVYFLSTIGTPGTHKPNHNNFNHDAYILKFNPNGIRVWGTFYGGPFPEYIHASAIDGQDNIIIAGYTESDTDIASANAHQTSRAGYTRDGFIAKINSAGLRVWGTYYGGSGHDILNDIAIDENSDIYVIGETESNNNMIFGTPHKAIKDGPIDAVLAHFNSTGNIVFGTYYGGENNEYFTDISYANQKIIIAGRSSSTTNLVTSNAPIPTSVAIPNTLNSIFSLFDENGQLLMGSYFYNNITDCEFDFDGNILIAGYTSHDGLGTPNSFQQFRYNHSEDAFLIKYNVNTFSKIWGTYFGGESVESETAIHSDRILQHIYLGGRTHSDTNIASANGYQKNKFNTWEDGYIVKFSHCQNNVQVSAAPEVCPGSSINLAASGGTSYTWSGPDGFSSTLQNPVITNASAINAGTYTCLISGTGDCDGSYSVTVKVEDKTAPVPTVANLPVITGNCKTVITTIPTATDVCLGNIVATTANPLQYLQPGNYVITWKYDDGNGNIATQNQNVIITSEPLPAANANQSFCKIANTTISDIVISGTGVKWYDASGNVLNTNTPLIDGTKYFATQTLNDCESAKFEITVAVNDPAAPTGATQQDFCSAQNPTLTNLVVAGTDIKWYDSFGNPLPISSPLSDGATYYASQTVNSCESTQKLAVKVTVANGGIPANDYAETFCNDTTSTTKKIDLNDYKSQLVVNPSAYDFDFYDVNNQQLPDAANQPLNIGINIFNVKISNALGCFVYVKLNLTLHPKPVLYLSSTEEFCNGQSVTLDAGAEFSSYQWRKDADSNVISTSRTFPVSEAGKYTVTVTNSFNCENSASIMVSKSPLASITGVQIVNSTATVILSESGDFLFSLDNKTWQTSNEFPNLSNGNHTVYVKTSGGCVIGQLNFSIFNVTNSFSPNGDGKNDTWKIDGLENYPNSEITVLDRWGNAVLNKMTSGSFEWDGKWNSRPLPTGNYWYQIKVSDGRILNGWLMIKNRN